MPAHPPGHPADSAHHAGAEQVEVQVPSGPPVLTAVAARELLAVIMEACQQLPAEPAAVGEEAA
jgi:hypothetical protein